MLRVCNHSISVEGKPRTSRRWRLSGNTRYYRCFIYHTNRTLIAVVDGDDVIVAEVDVDVGASAAIDSACCL